MPRGRIYSRWKYAEEAAKGLLDDGHLIRLEVIPDVEHVDPPGSTDPDDLYVYDDFIVTDLGPR